MNLSYRPAGNNILLAQGQIDESLFGTARFVLYQSGTSALSSSIIACIKLKGIAAAQAEVIIPAYACPDLVSAIVFAGAKPVLVDMTKDTAGFLIERLSSSISAHTVGIIVVNFLGIPDQLSDIKDICKAHGVFLINDSAQSFPSSKPYKWPGDFNIISFGRGKPVSLLHGGAVIVDSLKSYNALPNPTTAKPGLFDTLVKTLKIRLYNTVIKPRAYALIRKLPGLNIGETIYSPLDKINGMDDFEKKLIGSNIQKYQTSVAVTAYLHCQVSQITHTLLVQLVEKQQLSPSTRLLRYPILIKDRNRRDQFCAQTQDLGVSILYPKPLNQLESLSDILNSKIVYQNASDFSDHLVTLPCHQDISEVVVDQIIDVLKNILATED